MWDDLWEESNLWVGIETITLGYVHISAELDAAPPQRDFAFNEKDLFFAKFEV